MKLLFLDKLMGTAELIGKIEDKDGLTVAEAVAQLGGEVVKDDDCTRAYLYGTEYIADELILEDDSDLLDAEKVYMLTRDHCTLKEAKRHVQAGCAFYEDSEQGYKDYFKECEAGCIDLEDIPTMWKSLETVENGVKSYKIDFAL